MNLTVLAMLYFNLFLQTMPITLVNFEEYKQFEDRVKQNFIVRFKTKFFASSGNVIYCCH